jgi:hypothetical protein
VVSAFGLAAPQAAGKCAAKSGAERFYALNLAEFRRPAIPELRGRLGTAS